MFHREGIQLWHQRFSVLEQPRKYTEIKVEYVGQPSTTSNTSVYSLDSQSLLRGRCLECQSFLNDSTAGSICDACLKRKYRSEQYETYSRPLTGRSPRTSLYLPSSYTRDTNTLFPRVQPRASRFIACPNCGSPNMSSGTGTYSNFYCSACRMMITSAYNHWWAIRRQQDGLFCRCLWFW